MLIFIFSMCVTANLTGGHLSRDKPLFVKSFNQLRLTERAAFCLFLNCGNISSSRERERERDGERDGERKRETETEREMERGRERDRSPF